MNDALSIVGLYFTLIGFISGLFFTRLDGWYGSVKEFEGSLREGGSRSSDRLNREYYQEAQAKSEGLKASAPVASFVAVGLFTITLTLLSLLIPIESAAVQPTLYLRIPLIATVFAYWIGGSLIIKKGRSILRKKSHLIDDGIRG